MGILPCGSWERLLPTALRAVRSDAGLRAGVPSPDTTYLYPNRHSNWGRIDMCMFVSVCVYAVLAVRAQSSLSCG